MERLALIAVFGSIGALSRYAASSAAVAILGRQTVLGTLAVNLSGSFLIGLIAALATERDIISPTVRSALIVGFLGSYTTFSTLMFDTVTRLENGDPLTSFANLAASVILGSALCYAGIVLGRAVV